MQMAIKRAGIAPSEIDYINAHGTSTPLGDEIELGAVERLLGNAAGQGCRCRSTKSAIGHLLGAAGCGRGDLLACSPSATRSRRRPSISTIPRSKPPIDLVPHKAKKTEINMALSNSFGFGGTNASLIFRRASVTRFALSPYWRLGSRPSLSWCA